VVSRGSVGSRASTVYSIVKTLSPGANLMSPSNSSHGSHSILSSPVNTSTSLLDVDIDIDEELLDSEMKHLSDADSGSDEGDLTQKLPFSPLPKHESGTMVDKAFSETGSFSNFDHNGSALLSRTSSRYFNGQGSKSIDLDGITVVDTSDDEENGHALNEGSSESSSSSSSSSGSRFSGSVIDICMPSFVSHTLFNSI
jgi:hypothetical protein